MTEEEYMMMAEQLGEKNAEIERLLTKAEKDKNTLLISLEAVTNGLLKGWSDTGSRYEHRIADQRVEIARLKEDLRITIAVCNENTDLKKLIVELCDALEGNYLTQNNRLELTGRAREATR